MGPVTIILLVAAIVLAFLRARTSQLARYNRTSDAGPGEGRLLARAANEERYTPEGEQYLRRARLYRILFYVAGIGTLVAAWLGI